MPRLAGCKKWVFEDQTLELMYKGNQFKVYRHFGFQTSLDLCSGETIDTVLMPITKTLKDEDIKQLLMLTIQRDKRKMEIAAVGRVVVDVKENNGKFVLVLNSGEELKVIP